MQTVNDFIAVLPKREPVTLSSAGSVWFFHAESDVFGETAFRSTTKQLSNDITMLREAGHRVYTVA